MKKLLLIVSIFTASVLLESLPAKASPEASANFTTSLFHKEGGVNHKSAKRFKSPGKARRSKFTCTKKHGCWGHTVKSKHIKSDNCKKRM